jgi:hypothetical protein
VIVTWPCGVIHLSVRLSSHLWVHFSPLLAFSIGECVSQCFVPALPVQELFAVAIVAIPALSSPTIKIVAPRNINLVRLVRYRHCSCNSGSDSGSYSALELGHVGA